MNDGESYVKCILLEFNIITSKQKNVRENRQLHRLYNTLGIHELKLFSVESKQFCVKKNLLHHL